MKSKLLEITPQYNTFVDDQVLTAAQLNEFIEYFNEQDRLTRVCLSGVGLLCGFTVTLDEGSVINISQGCGITTDGDLLKLQKDGKKDSKKYTLDSKNIIIDSLSFSHYKEFNDVNAKYAHFRTESDSVIDLVELIPTELVNEEEHDSLSDFDLSDKVVILYLESYLNKPNNCTTTNCDNQGQENVQNVKVLLASKEDVEDVINAMDPIFTRHNIFEALTNLPETAVSRVILDAGLGSSNNVKDYAVMATAFKDKITEAKLPLHDAYSDLFENFSEILSINTGTQNTVLNQIDNLDDFSSDEKIQYRYDLVKDISDSYNEILSLLLKLKTECCPSIEAFPKHLLLGCLFPSQNEYPELRHQWYPSPTNTEYENYILKAKNLVNRVAILLDNFLLDNEGDLKVTPSKLCGDLGDKAIPVYYNVDTSLLKAWSFQKTKNYKQAYNLSYHTSLLASSWPKTPLEVSLDCHDFYRIEGHFDLDPQTTFEEIKTIKRNYGLDFECLLFDLKDDAKEFTAFLREHPSVTHRAGVPTSGTYILISEEEKVVADFCLGYKATISESSGSCCTLRECSYAWISSLKYLNNLSRSLKGTQSVNRPMPQNYILNVVEYTINGTKLINTTVPIIIPLYEIFNRRMHAITEALNNRFHEGIVFDYNETEKRFVITYAKDDTFKIRFQEATLNSENPTYTYSPNGMFRNNKVFRQRMMTCRELRNYSPGFYKGLQKELAPVNKDDDYGYYDEKWRKWQEYVHEMVDMSFFGNMPRFITNIEEFPPSITPVLNNVLRDLRAVDSSVALAIDGEWVNGTWLSKEMVDYYNSRPNDTNDPVVLFMKLRANLFNKALKRETHLTIYITNKNYSTAYDDVIENYKHDVDIFFAPTTGPNAFTL